jgi:hypothetical protein
VSAISIQAPYDFEIKTIYFVGAIIQDCDDT